MMEARRSTGCLIRIKVRMLKMIMMISWIPINHSDKNDHDYFEEGSQHWHHYHHYDLTVTKNRDLNAQLGWPNTNTNTNTNTNI